MDEHEMVEAEEARTSRRRLLQGAAAAGVGAAVIGAPGISVVPAYGQQISNLQGPCFGFAFSSNDPTGKGWVDRAEAGGELTGDAVAFDRPTGTADFGPVQTVLEWDVAAFGSFPESIIKVTVNGCLNIGTGAIDNVEGLPTGFKIRFTNNGSGQDDNDGSCSGGGTLLPDGAEYGKIAPSLLGNGGTATISASGADDTTGLTCQQAKEQGKNKEGRINWVFNIVKG